MKKLLLIFVLLSLLINQTTFVYALTKIDTRIATNKIKVLNEKIKKGSSYETIYKQQLTLQNNIKKNRDSKNKKSVAYKNLDKNYAIFQYILENLIDHNTVNQIIATNVPVQVQEKIVVKKQTCDEGWYYNEGTMSCQPNNPTRSCSVTNGTGKQIWNGNNWNTCTVSSCISGYSISNGSCLVKQSTEPVIPTTTAANQIACSSDQHKENNTCISNIKSCTASNGVGQQSWNGNNWGSCVVSSFTCNESTHRYWNSTNVYTTAIYNAELRLQEAQSLLKMREEIFARVLNVAATNAGGGQLPEWEFYERINPKNPIYNSYVVDINNAKTLISQTDTNLNNAIINSSRALEKETDKTKLECISNIKSCTISNGVGQQSWSSNAWGSCVVSSCNTGYSVSGNSCAQNQIACSSDQHLENNTCISNIKSCTISNGVGQQSWSSNAWGSCVVSSCNTGYSTLNNMCISCGDNVTAGGYTYTTKLGLDGKCWTSQNMKHAPSAGKYWSIGNETFYDFAAANSNICSTLGTGWNLPSDTQWTTLINAGSTGWLGNKLSGLISSLPGSCEDDGINYNQEKTGNWWSSSYSEGRMAYIRWISYSDSIVYRNSNYITKGISVICIKN